MPFANCLGKSAITSLADALQAVNSVSRFAVDVVQAIVSFCTLCQ
jgi:hypothetical protein